jgi:hypothetical protein
MNLEFPGVRLIYNYAQVSVDVNSSEGLYL